MPDERKRIGPMAVVTAPARVLAQRRSLIHFVGSAPLSDPKALAKVRELVLLALERAGR